MQNKEWDFDALISKICYVREKPIDPHVKESVIEELRRLNFYGWDVVCKVTETVMANGRYKLNDNLWLIVRNAVNDKIREIRDSKRIYTDHEPKIKQSGFSLPALQTRILTEIGVWLKVTPPLRFKNILVEKRDSQHSQFDFGNWIDQGKPQTDNVLLDEYLNIYYDALIEEEQRQVDGIIFNKLTDFYDTLRSLRVAQLSKRTGGSTQNT